MKQQEYIQNMKQEACNNTDYERTISELYTRLQDGEDNTEYNAFVDKFKAKRTTGDCYTPPNIYEAVVEWCEAEYNIDRSKIVRPFYPNGDYKAFQYSQDCIVLDNPPFSILSKIVGFYVENNIKFFLFAPSLTLFNASDKCTAICTGVGIIYENKAQVSTSFLTNMNGKIRLRSAPALYKKLLDANNKNKGADKQMSKYVYPANVITAAQVSYFSKYGIEFSAGQNETCKIGALDEQKKHRKTIFGGGYLMNTEKAKENLLARALAESNSGIMKWSLSQREADIVQKLDNSKQDNHNQQ